jgi:hypothetical protein
MGPGRPKNKIAKNGFKIYLFIGLVDMNPTQLERAQTNIVCSRYHYMFVSSKRQKKDVDFIVHTVHTAEVAGYVGTDVGKYRWTSQSVTCGTTARVTCGTR